MRKKIVIILFLTVQTVVSFAQTDSEFKKIGTTFFTLLKNNQIDSLTAMFMPDQTTFKLILDKYNVSSEDSILYSTINNDFNKIKNSFKERMQTEINDYKEHDLKFDELQIESISFAHNKEGKSGNFKATELTSYKIYCKDKKNKYCFYIMPLYNFNKRWYFFETQIGFNVLK